MAEGLDRALLWDSEISHKPLPGEGILLGGLICDFFKNYTLSAVVARELLGQYP